MTAREFVDFINECPTPMHFTEYARKVLLAAGYTELNELDVWETVPEKGFVIRSETALIAFQNGGLASSIIVGTHDDSPCLKAKPGNKVAIMNANCEGRHISPYGGGLWATYFDRDLRLAGKVIYKEGKFLKSALFDSEEAVAIVPSPCCKTMKELTSYNVDVDSDLNPIIGLGTESQFKTYIADKLGIKKDNIVDYDLLFVDAEKASVVGKNGEFIGAHRIDNLGSTYSAMKAFLDSKPNNTLNVLVVFDHEEIGSATRTGARGNFLPNVLEKIVGKEELPSLIARSLVVSSDNAHALHPNFSEKHDGIHAPVLGKGLVLKRSPGSAYATDMTSAFPLRQAAKKLGLNLQMLINRNDIPSGSTIGPAVSTQLGIPTVDVGQPQLAMHSIKELVAINDVDDTTAILKELYEHFEEYRFKE